MGVFAVSWRFPSKDHDALAPGRPRRASRSVAGAGVAAPLCAFFGISFRKNANTRGGKPAHIVDAQQEAKQAERKAEQAQQEANASARSCVTWASTRTLKRGQSRVACGRLVQIDSLTVCSTTFTRQKLNFQSCWREPIKAKRSSSLKTGSPTPV